MTEGRSPQGLAARERAGSSVVLGHADRDDEPGVAASVRTLHIDCFSGIAGDMMVAALIDLGAGDGIDLAALVDSFGLDATLSVTEVRRAGFRAKRVEIGAPPVSKHRHLPDIVRILDESALSPEAKHAAKRMFGLLGEAEAAAHGIPIEKVHFHEVGAVDSIVDIALVAALVESLGLRRITCRPVPVGSGWDDCDHGRLPVPAPATAKLLEGTPIESGPTAGELTTPTGACVVKAYADAFEQSPAMTLSRTGLGAGSRDPSGTPNVLRLLIGTTERSSQIETERLVVLEANLDDRSPETLAHAQSRMLELGALDAYQVPIVMKKGRLGTMFCVLTDEARLDDLQQAIFRETGTLGLRRRPVDRPRLPRWEVTVATDFGPIAGKTARVGDAERFSAEHDDCARIATAEGVPIERVHRAAEAAFAAGRVTRAADPAESEGSL